MDTEAIVRRFRNERQILASLDHPFIGGLLDGGTTPDGLPYFAMEFVEGAADRRLLRIASPRHHGAAGAVPEDLRGGPVRPPEPDHPPRHQAGQRAGHRRRHAEAARLRHRQAAESRARLDRRSRRPPTGSPLMTPEYASPEQVRGEAVTTATRRLLARRAALRAARPAGGRISSPAARPPTSRGWSAIRCRSGRAPRSPAPRTMSRAGAEAVTAAAARPDARCADSRSPARSSIRSGSGAASPAISTTSCSRRSARSRRAATSRSISSRRTSGAISTGCR